MLDSIFVPPSVSVVKTEKLNLFYDEVISELNSKQFIIHNFLTSKWSGDFKSTNFTSVVKNFNRTSDVTCDLEKYFCEAKLSVESDSVHYVDWQIPCSPGMNNVSVLFKSDTLKVRVEFGQDGILSAGKMIVKIENWNLSNVKVMSATSAEVSKFLESRNFDDVKREVDKSIINVIISKFVAKQSMLD